MVQTQVTVTIESLAPESGVFLTPFWVGFHDGGFDTYDSGSPASEALESLAEDGNTTPISELFLASGDGTVDGTILGVNGIQGPIDPSEVAVDTFTLESNDDSSRYFNYASMVIPSNDAFIANGDPILHEVFDENGNFLGLDFIVAGSEVLDAGTEVNDELAENTAFFSQENADTGDDENGTVGSHPGFIENGRILSEDGTSENAPAAFTNADFTESDYQIARITVSIVDESVNISSSLDGDQEVDTGDGDASGTSTLTLNEIGNNLEYSLTVFGLDFGANGLIEGGAQTEDTSDDVTRLHIHSGARGENGGVAFALFDTVAPELGNELGIQGNQDDDLEVTLNNDGSVTLTGIWEGTDPAAISLLEFVSDIRETGEDSDLDLYWNVHTNEYPAGAIRGQLIVDNEEPTVELNTPFIRFQNENAPGTYIYATGAEADSIRTNFTNFVEEGIAFNAGVEPDDELIPFYRFQSTQTPNTYLFVAEEERNNINADPNFSNAFDEEGIAFYVFGAGTNKGAAFSRFQNSDMPGTYLYATGAEANNIRANFTNFVEEGIAFETII